MKEAVEGTVTRYEDPVFDGMMAKHRAELWQAVARAESACPKERRFVALVRFQEGQFAVSVLPQAAMLRVLRDSPHEALHQAASDIERDATNTTGMECLLDVVLITEAEVILQPIYVYATNMPGGGRA